MAGEMGAFARPEWIETEEIRSLGCQPLVFRGEILGVLAVFNRHPCVERPGVSAVIAGTRRRD